MSSAAHPVPSSIERLERAAMAVGGAGVLACLAGALMDPPQFFRSYLVAFLFWVGVGVGCLSVLMIQYVSGGLWGLVVRRILEAGSRMLFFAVLFFLPLGLGLKHVYPWADAGRLGADKALREAVELKGLYLTPQYFVIRALFYFVVWALLAHFLSKWSLEQDGGWDRKRGRRLRSLAGGGLVLMGLTITFAAVDWAMSLDPRWYSTIYGILFMIGQALSALALAIVLVALMGDEAPFAGVLRSTTIHDLGKLLLAFVMFWAYISISQFLIVWSGNLPEEIPWYVHRLGGGWQVVALLLVLLHFALPFLLLLSRDLKRNPRALAAVASGVLAVRVLDLYWLVGPELHGPGFALHWLDVAALLAVGGIWLALFARQLRSRALLPAGDPELAEALAALPAGH